MVQKKFDLMADMCPLSLLEYSEALYSMLLQDHEFVMRDLMHENLKANEVAAHYNA